MGRGIGVLVGALLLAACSAPEQPRDRDAAPTPSSVPSSESSPEPAPTPRDRPERPLALRASDFDPGRAMAAVRHLAGEIGPRQATSEAYAEAARWVAGYFERLGYRVEQQPVRAPAGTSWGVPVPAGRSDNVIARPRGLGPDEPHLVVGAHLDTVAVAPGAEDNASGVGVMLAAAAAAAEARTRLPVVFVAFGAEEPRSDDPEDHHYGSRAYVASLGERERDAVRGMVSLDRVGVGSVVPVGSAGESDPVQRSLLAAAGRVGVPTLPDPDQRSSDHWSFVREGLPGARLGSTSYAAYHSADDVPSVVQPEQLDRVGRLLLSWLAPAADPALTIAFAGDVHFEGALGGVLTGDGAAFRQATRTLREADLAMLNLETSLGSGGTPDPGKRYTFQAPLSALDVLADAGVDVVSMANNHALDYGTHPLPAVLDALDEAPVEVVGLGRDVADAFAPAYLDVRGTRVAALAATLADLDPTADPTGDWAATGESPGTGDAVRPARLLRTVRQTAQRADVVVVYLHWGVQGERCPTAGQRSLAARLVERGADVIVGSHAHLLQGDGRLGPGYVAYGLGNYAWYTRSTDPSPATGVLSVALDERGGVVQARWEGAEIGTDGLPVPLTGAEAVGFGRQVVALRECAGLQPSR